MDPERDQQPTAPDGAMVASRRSPTLKPWGFDGVDLPLDVLTAVLALSLWMACGSVVLAVADGLGAHPARRGVIGGALVLACVVALWRRREVCAALWTRPWLVLPIAVVQLGLAAADGLVGSPYVAFSLTSIGIAVVAARARTVWLCVALLALGYLALASIQYSPSELATDGRLGTVLGAVVGYVAAAVPLMLLRQRFTWLTGGVESFLDDIRHGAPAFTPALGAAMTLGRVALPAGRPRLTPAERRVVEALASGSAPKQMAREWGVSLATVRTHVKNAKRKMGARTLPELAAMASRPDWQAVADDRS